LDIVVLRERFEGSFFSRCCLEKPKFEGKCRFWDTMAVALSQ